MNDRFDSQEFHELMMDYRSDLLSPAAAYGRVLDFIRSAPKQGEAVAEWVNHEQGFQCLVEPASIPDGTKLYAAPSVEPAPADPHAPKEVFLQLCGDSSADEGPVNYEAGDVSWCWHQVFESDVRYVQAAPAPHQEPGWQPSRDAAAGDVFLAYCYHSHDLVPKPFLAGVRIDHLRGHWTTGPSASPVKLMGWLPFSFLPPLPKEPKP